METATKSMAIGVNLIVRNFLAIHAGTSPVEMKTEITEDVLVVLIRSPHPLTETGLTEGSSITVVSNERIREHLLKRSEFVLRERVADFLQRSIKSIHYIFGTQPEDMSIIIYLDPV